MKAQSAIEYLTTYGWMLLSVAVVSGAVYSMVDPGCRENYSGFTGESLQIDQTGTGEADFSLLLRNSRSEQITLQEVVITDIDSGQSTNYSLSESLDPGKAEVVSVPRSNAGCNSYDVTFEHSILTLDDQYSSGRITVRGDLVDVSSPPELDSFSANY